MKNVWDKSFWYSFFRPYVQWAVRTSYSRITVNGLDNVPDSRKSSVIIAANHCNTMMDSLVLLQSRKDPDFFVARADIFSNPFIARILTNLRIMPIYRKRDGGNSAERNEAVFDNVVEGLGHGMAFSIHPEGTHRARRSLLPIKKGAFRIAQQAAETNPDRDVFIVPAGLEYYDYFNLMRPVTLTYGKPMRIKGGEDLDNLSKELHDRIAGLITWFPDDENLAAAEQAFYDGRRRSYGTRDKVLAAALLPVAALSGFLCSPILAASAWFCSRIKDAAWLNTARFGCKLVLTPFTTAGAAVAGFIHLPWLWALILVAATLYAHPVFYRILVYYKDMKAFFARKQGNREPLAS